MLDLNEQILCLSALSPRWAIFVIILEWELEASVLCDNTFGGGKIFSIKNWCN